MPNLKQSSGIIKRTDFMSALDIPENKAHFLLRNLEFFKRALTGFFMISLMILCIMMGPICVILIVLSVQFVVYKEIINLAYQNSREKNIPWFRSITWYFLGVFMFFLHGESFFGGLKNSLNHFVHIRHHRLVSFLAYTFGIVLFVINLRKGHYRSQFAQFGITHVALILILIQAQAMLLNILEGLIWY